MILTKDKLFEVLAQVQAAESAKSYAERLLSRNIQDRISKNYCDRPFVANGRNWKVVGINVVAHLYGSQPSIDCDLHVICTNTAGLSAHNKKKIEAAHEHYDEKKRFPSSYLHKEKFWGTLSYNLSIEYAFNSEKIGLNLEAPQRDY